MRRETSATETNDTCCGNLVDDCFRLKGTLALQVWRTFDFRQPFIAFYIDKDGLSWCAPSVCPVANLVGGAGRKLLCLGDSDALSAGEPVYTLSNALGLIDSISVGVRKDYLAAERKQAYASVITPDCRTRCTGCGANLLYTEGKCDD